MSRFVVKDGYIVGSLAGVDVVVNYGLKDGLTDWLFPFLGRGYVFGGECFDNWQKEPTEIICSVMNRLDQILSTHQSHILSYASWYLSTHDSRRSDPYSDKIHYLTCEEVVYSNFFGSVNAFEASDL